MIDNFDPEFYRKTYNDLRFLNQFELKQHYINSGQRENRLGSLRQLNMFINNLPYKFDCDVYISMYPDVPVDPVQAKVHYYMHGKAENRIYNKQQLAVVDNLNESQLPEIKSTKPTKKIPGNKRINILIRTHDRPEMFRQCYSSIMGQTYENIHVYINVQTLDDFTYVVTQTVNDENVTIIHNNQSSSADYFFNDFSNKLLQSVTTGWVINLDDDDMFTTPDAVCNISQSVGKNTMVIWKYKRPDMIISPEPHVPLTGPGTITSTSYCLPVELAQSSTWVEIRQGDYYYIEPIYNDININKIYLDDIYTKYQNRNQVASYGKNTQHNT